MNLYTIACLAGLLALCSCASDTVRIESNSYYKNKRYKYKISSERLAQCPIWDRREELNPPHSAAKALDQAEKFMTKIPAPKNQFWTLDELALEDFGEDHWAWRVTYSVGGIVRNNPQTMQCWILMDGALLEPKITRYPN